MQISEETASNLHTSVLSISLRPDSNMLEEAGHLSFKLKAAREEAAAKWLKIAKELPRRKTHKRTDLIGNLALLQYRGHGPGQTILVIFSDPRQSTLELNFEIVQEIAVEKTLSRIRASQGLPNLAGYRVYFLGVDPGGKSRRYLEGLKEFRLEFFKAAGAEVFSFSIERRLPEF